MDESYPDGENKDVSMDLEIPIQSKFATDGFPADASAELSNKADELFNHSVEELLDPPFFGWILLQEAIDADWSELPEQPLLQHSKTWLKKINVLGIRDYFFCYLERKVSTSIIKGVRESTKSLGFNLKIVNVRNWGNLSKVLY